MHSYYGICLEDDYRQILKLVLTQGERRKVRSFNTIELSPFIYSLSDPLKNIVSSPLRNINRAFSVAEFLWLMSGRNDLEMISHYNSKLKAFSDNGSILSGAYGPTLVDQLKYVFAALEKDLFTRQAVISTWKPSPVLSKDIPCTLSLQFLVDSTYHLNLIVNMRSNDAWLGFPYDVYNFTMIQNYLAFKLSLEVGRYYHVAGSMHLYEEHIVCAKALSEKPTMVMEIQETPKINSDKLETLLQLERQLRRGNNEPPELDSPWSNLHEILKNHCEKKIKKHCTL